MNLPRRSIEEFLSHESEKAFRKAFTTQLGAAHSLPDTSAKSNGQKSLISSVDLTKNVELDQIYKVIEGFLTTLGYKNNSGIAPPVVNVNKLRILASHIYNDYVQSFKAKLEPILLEKIEALTRFKIGEAIMFFDDDFLLALNELKVTYEALNSPMAKAIAIVEDFTDPEISFSDKCEIAESFRDYAEGLAPNQSIGDPDAVVIDSVLEALDFITHQSLRSSGQTAADYFDAVGE